MSNNLNRVKGFTLLEVMVALTIFAVLAATVSQVVSTNVSNHLRIESMVLANWIAENELINLRTAGWDEVKNTRKDVEMANRKWVVVIEAKPMKKLGGIAIPLDVREVLVKVANAESPDAPIHQLIGYIAND